MKPYSGQHSAMSHFASSYRQRVQIIIIMIIIIIIDLFITRMTRAEEKKP